MRVNTDDEIYAVDNVWLGPADLPFGLTLPRARYIAWGIGVTTFLGVFWLFRTQLGFDLGFFTVAWAVIIAVAITRFITAKITHERPALAVFQMWLHELRAPGKTPAPRDGSLSPASVRRRSLPAARGSRSHRKEKR